MNTDLTENWNKKKVKLKNKYQILTDKDLCCREGKENEMIEILESKLGKSKQELLTIILNI
ncbi:MAG: general stress protein CsbD [Bacteroidales bacterium]|nr:general stress protein CsbD [Bacteroidales bacterium]MBK8882496.1 general stress protein CsbD [Bacteroidales bacterium]